MATKLMCNTPIGVVSDSKGLATLAAGLQTSDIGFVPSSGETKFQVSFPLGTKGSALIELFNSAGEAVKSVRVRSGTTGHLRLTSGTTEGQDPGVENGWLVSPTNFGPGSRVSLTISGSLGNNPSVLVKVYTETQSQNEDLGVWYRANALGNGHIEADVSIACVTI